MADNPNQPRPRKDDVVLGGHNQAPVGSVVLGGLEGIKRRLASGVEEEQIAALKQALKSGEAGLDLVIQALNDESRQVEKAAYQLLRKSVRPKAKQVLQKHSPWRIFECIRTIQGHSDAVWSVTVSPDSQTIVTGSMDRTIKIWHLKTGKEIRTLQGHLDTVESVVFSTDGQTIVSGSRDKTIKIWNSETGQELHTLQEQSPLRSIALSADGQTLVSGADGSNTIKIWNLNTGQLLRTLYRHSMITNVVAINPNGNARSAKPKGSTLDTIESAIAKREERSADRSPTDTPHYQLPLTPLAKMPRILFTSLK